MCCFCRFPAIIIHWHKRRPLAAGIVTPCILAPLHWPSYHQQSHQSQDEEEGEDRDANENVKMAKWTMREES